MKIRHFACRRLAFCVLFAAVLLSIFSGVKAYAFEAKLGSGTDGSISWEAWNYDFKWTLKVTGSGRMNDYGSPQSWGGLPRAPWYSTVTLDDGSQLTLGSYQRIEIGRGITYIGSHAFDAASGYNDITEIEIPDSVTGIGAYAFANQRYLHRIIVPNSVTAIGEGAFDTHTTIVCRSDSYAFRYAREKGYTNIQLTDLTITLTLEGGATSALLTRGESIGYTVSTNIPGLEPELSVSRGLLEIDKDTHTVKVISAGSSQRLSGALTASLYGVSASCTITVRIEYSITYVEDLMAKVLADDVDYVDNSVNETHFTEGTTYTLKAPRRKGYTFLGWYVNTWIDDKGCFELQKIQVLKGGVDKLLGLWAKTAVGQVAKPNLTGKKSRKMTITWEAVTNAKGYQVQWSLKSGFKSGTKSKTLKAKKLTVSKLTKKKTYYVRVRAYRLDSTGAKVYGKWSPKAKLKITK